MTDYIQKRRGQTLLFPFEYKLSVAKFDIKVKVTTWIGQGGASVGQQTRACVISLNNDEMMIG